MIDDRSQAGREGLTIRLQAEAVRIDLPPGWEGGITRNPARTRSAAPEDRLGDGVEGATADSDPGPRSNRGPGVQRAEDGAVVMPVTHVANFALPAALDVFGTQAVGDMAAGDAFVSLVEYGPAEVDTPLFARQGVPRRLRAGDFSSRTLNRILPDQVGTQVFATEAGRAFCLYVVLAGRARIATALAGVNRALSTLEITPR